MSLLLAQAAVNDANIHFDKLYSYRIPAELAGRVFPGSMVLVPFGRGSKARMAVVLAVGEVDESDAPKGLKTLYDAAPEDARLTPDLLELGALFKRAHLLHLVRGRQGSHPVWRTVPARCRGRQARHARPPDPLYGAAVHAGGGAAGKAKARPTPTGRCRRPAKRPG